MQKKRLENILFERGIVRNSTDAFILVTGGRVLVDGQKAVSPAQLVSVNNIIEVRPEREFVGRGAYKLEAAIERFGVDVRGKVCADIGAATGGFTDVLLKHGAAKVYAIDVGRGKLDLKLWQDPRVVVMEETNVLALGDAFGKRLQAPARPAALAKAPRSSRRGRDTMPARRLERSQSHPPGASGGEDIDLVTIDLSFTSLRAVLPVVRGWLSREGSVIALFKPQYEIEDKSLLKHGILVDGAARLELVGRFRGWLKENGWRERGMMESPIRGSEGNVEYLFCLKPMR